MVHRHHGLKLYHTVAQRPSGRPRTQPPQFLQAPCALLQMIIALPYHSANSTHHAAQSVSRTLQLSRTTVPLVLFCITCHAARSHLVTHANSSPSAFAVWGAYRGNSINSRNSVPGVN